MKVRSILQTKVVLALLLITVVTGSAFAWFGSRETSKSTAPAGEASAAPAELEVVTVVVDETGFHPSEITRGAGRFILSVDCRALAGAGEERRFRVTGVRGETLKEFNLPRRASSWRQAVDLPAGDYTVIEAGQRDSHFRITVR